MVNKSVIIASDNTTIVSKIIIGRPVRRVTSGAFSINSLDGVDVTTKVNGSVLVYNSLTQKWTATLDLDQQNFNGGSY
jgi:hypothetical protein